MRIVLWISLFFFLSLTRTIHAWRYDSTIGRLQVECRLSNFWIRGGGGDDGDDNTEDDDDDNTNKDDNTNSNAPEHPFVTITS